MAPRRDRANSRHLGSEVMSELGREPVFGEVAPNLLSHGAPHLVRESLSEHEGQQPKQARRRAGPVRQRTNGDKPVRGPELAQKCVQHLLPSLKPSLGRAAKLSGEAGDDVELDHDECRQVGRLDHSVAVECRGVVPPTVVAVLVVGERVAGRPSAGQPVVGPAREPVEASSSSSLDSARGRAARRRWKAHPWIGGFT